MAHALDARGVQSMEESVTAALGSILPFFGATSGSIVFGVRPPGPRNDAIGGWRPVWFHGSASRRMGPLINAALRHLKWSPRDGETLGKHGFHRSKAGSMDDYPGHKSHVALARYLGTEHRLGAVVPVSDNVEVHFLIDRPARLAPYDAHAPVNGLALTHAIEPIARRWSRQLGLLNGTILSGRERQALVCLLKGLSEKEGASLHGLRPTSFHQVVVRVYRKFGVASRGELSSLFLSDKPVPDTGSWNGKLIRYRESGTP